MRALTKALQVFIILGIAAILGSPSELRANSDKQQQGQQSAAQTAAKTLGAIKAINSSVLTVAPDSGADVTVQVQDSTKIVRVEPGQKDLKGAIVLRIQDLTIGDRILVRGKLSDDGKTLIAASIIAMKHVDVEAKQQREREDWQRRGVGGLVKSVDAPTGTITISIAALGGSKDIAIHVSKGTVLRRYAPDSVKIDDAKLCTIDQIKGGDQLRARGDRNADGSEIKAEEIVTGAFRNIAGTISSLDASANTMTVKDLIGKSSVLVRVAPSTQLHVLPPEMAQRIAMRLKGAPPNQDGQGTPPAANAPQSQGTAPAPGYGRQRPNGSPDFQQLVNRLPAAGLADFQKGEAVMIVSTQDADSGEVTAISILGGVEPILTASPNGQGMVLSPWSLEQTEGDSGTQ